MAYLPLLVGQDNRCKLQRFCDTFTGRLCVVPCSVTYLSIYAGIAVAAPIYFQFKQIGDAQRRVRGILVV